MTDWRTELRRTWSLQREPVDDDVVRSHVLTPDAARPLRVFTAVDGSRHLLVPGDAAADPIRGDALTSEMRTLVFDGVTARYLDIACRRPALFEVFDELLASIVVDAIDSGDPLGAAVGMLGRWRDLLRAWSASMTHEREMGLFAELHVLELVSRRASILEPGIWRGPLREPKDLVGSDWWIEVKAAGPKRSGVWINGLEQLADVDGTSGLLAVLTIEEDDGGRSVEDLAAGLRDRCIAPELFDDLVLQAGWVNHDDAKRWTVTEVVVVASGVCPRLAIAAADVPVGVGRIRYELDIAVARSMSVRDSVAELLRIGERS